MSVRCVESSDCDRRYVKLGPPISFLPSAFLSTPVVHHMYTYSYLIQPGRSNSIAWISGVVIVSTQFFVLLIAFLYPLKPARFSTLTYILTDAISTLRSFRTFFYTQDRVWVSAALLWAHVVRMCGIEKEGSRLDSYIAISHFKVMSLYNGKV